MDHPLNILVFQPDFSKYGSAYYQHQFTEALGRVHRIFRYGPDLEGYNAQQTIHQVLDMCPFEPDLICFAAGWEIESEEIPESDPHPNLQVSSVDIPSVMVLNKEYKKLDRKFQFIQDNDIKLVFTVHHNYSLWEEEVGVPFVHFPFAVDPSYFSHHNEPKRYDLGFSGRLQPRWDDIRARLKDHLYLRWPIKSPRYWRTKVFWAEPDSNRILRYIRPQQIQDYARLMNQSKIWISTPSPIGLIGTRYYEIMSSKTLMFCSKSGAYEGLFKDGEHCVEFDLDLSDFEDKLFFYLNHEDERQEIIEKAHAHVLRNHTWVQRIEQFTNSVNQVVLR